MLNKSIFDKSITPIWFDLTSVVRGFREGMPTLKSGDFSIDQNNLPVFSNYGQGAIFMPSGLGYFGNPSGGIPAYSPIIFKIELYKKEINLGLKNNNKTKYVGVRPDDTQTIGSQQYEWSIEDINITMGLPLKQIPFSAFIEYSPSKLV